MKPSTIGPIVIGEYPCVCSEITGPHRHQLASMQPGRWSEDGLLDVVFRIAAAYAVIAHHEPDSRLQTVRGWPDVELVGDRGVLYRELKSHYGALTIDQRAIGSKLQRAGQSWAVWRPSHLINAHIEHKIAEIA